MCTSTFIMVSVILLKIVSSNQSIVKLKAYSTHTIKTMNKILKMIQLNEYCLWFMSYKDAMMIAG